ncbi:LysE family transporter [Ancylobacter sp. 6x-1]|uniref:LysE family transporter n=1 Tax=Ancylobacter crimeensis TaxID=2579147 RepID=A0ABT0D9J3_9HYPH|nr:LysE family transporter [Ancylobacter crimeensis]MCK0196626.1 LysE family transporter [Ancylobacter crimeensis]
MTLFATAILTGAGVGLSIAAPIGPASMLCIQRTIAAGWLTGLVTGLGVATVHLTYGALVAGCGTAFVALWSDAALLSLASGLVLLVFSVRVLRRSPVLPCAAESRRNLASAYCGAVGFGFLNPVTPILFAAAAPAFLDHGTTQVLLAAGVFLGSFGWWILLSITAALLRGRLTNRRLHVMNRGAGLLLAALAVNMMMKGALAAMPAVEQAGVHLSWSSRGPNNMAGQDAAARTPRN